MGNIGSSGHRHRRQSSNRTRSHPSPPPPTPPPQQPPPPPHLTANRYMSAVPYGNPGGYYPTPLQTGLPMPLPAPYDHHHQHHGGGGRYPLVAALAPYVEHQKAVTIRNDVNIKRETLRLEADDNNPAKFLVAFTFDATVSGSITIIFFAKEGEDCKLTPTKDNILPPVIVHFEQGLGQTFKQPSGTGIDFSMFRKSELLREVDVDVYPLAVKADASPPANQSGKDGPLLPCTTNSQITQAIFDTDKGECKVKVLKQILWVNGMRYELQEIYGIGNSVEGEFDVNDPGKECVICLSEPRDTTVLPCRHMCMCSGCAKVLRFQTNRCPICRQPVERLLEIKVNDKNEKTET